jgi:hypothetical protein
LPTCNDGGLGGLVTSQWPLVLPLCPILASRREDLPETIRAIGSLVSDPAAW